MATASIAVYSGWFRPWHLRWGSTVDETHADLPGDELVAHPMLEATRSVSIDAPPQHVWPWIVQMGFGRGGFYSIDLIDNDGRPSARRLVPELQHLAVGDVMPTGPHGGFEVVTIDEPHHLAMRAVGEVIPGVDGISVVSMWLRPLGRGSRLTARVRAEFDTNMRSRLYALVFEPGDFVMMRRMLLGLAQRAEATTADDLAALDGAAPAGP